MQTSENTNKRQREPLGLNIQAAILATSPPRLFILQDTSLARASLSSGEVVSSTEKTPKETENGSLNLDTCSLSSRQLSFMLSIIAG